MPLFVSFLLGGLLNLAGSLAGKVLIGLGISVITYTGVSTSIDWLKTGVVTSLSGLPQNVIGMLSLMHVGSCVSMIFSAVVVKYTLAGLTSGTMRKWVK